jgi:hypothetical protein
MQFAVQGCLHFNDSNIRTAQRSPAACKKASYNAVCTTAPSAHVHAMCLPAGRQHCDAADTAKHIVFLLLPAFCACICRPSSFKIASAPFELLMIDLSNLPAAAAGPATAHCNSSSTQLHDDCDALLVWFELHAPGGASVSTVPYTSRSSSSWPKHAASSGSRNAGNNEGSSSRSSSAASQPASTNFGLGLYYLDYALAATSSPQQQQQQQQQQKQHHSSMAPATQAVISTTVQQQLRLHFSATVSAPAQQTSTTLHSQAPTCKTPTTIGSSSSGGSSSSSSFGVCSYTWSPHGVPHQAMLPRWHFDMLGDEARNSAYDAAIRCGRVYMHTLTAQQHGAGVAEC